MWMNFAPGNICAKTSMRPVWVGDLRTTRFDSFSVRLLTNSPNPFFHFDNSSAEIPFIFRYS